MTKQEKIAKLLAQGLKPAQVASIVGCTPAYLSQLSKEEAFKQLLAQEIASANTVSDLAEEELLNTKYLAAEHALLNQITESVALMEPRDQIRALDVISARQGRQADRLARLRLPQQQALTMNNYVQLTLPVHSVPEYKINAEGEIISIDNQPMAALSSQAVKQLFTTLKETPASDF